MAKESISGKTSIFTFATGYISYYRTDEKHSVTDILDKAGKVKATIAYDEYGVIENPEVVSTGGNIFAYTGHVYEESTGLYYAKARYYEASNGRFISEDMYLGDFEEIISLNRYIYCYNNSLKYVDPDGNMAVSFLRALSSFYNNNSFSKEQTSTAILLCNGLGVYTAFHEMAQVNVVKKLYGRGKESILEYSITSKTEKNIFGKYKKMEADIVSENYIWEVKPYGQKGDKQLNKYISNDTKRKLQKGYTMGSINNIPVLAEYKMVVSFKHGGTVNYRFYKKNEREEIVYVKSTEVKKEYLKRWGEASLVVIGVVGLTVAEDIFSGGLGIADDLPSLGVAFTGASKIIFGY